MTWDIDSVIKRIYWAAEHHEGVDWQQVHFLGKILARYDGDQVIPRLLALCGEECRGERYIYIVQEYVGQLLWRLKLKCSLPPTDLLRPILKTYELSVEQIPWALAHAFGKESFIASLKELQDQTSDPVERRSIKTLEWWLQAFDSPYSGT